MLRVDTITSNQGSLRCCYVLCLTWELTRDNSPAECCRKKCYVPIGCYQLFISSSSFLIPLLVGTNSRVGLSFPYYYPPLFRVPHSLLRFDFDTSCDRVIIAKWTQLLLSMRDMLEMGVNRRITIDNFNFRNHLLLLLLAQDNPLYVSVYLDNPFLIDNTYVLLYFFFFFTYLLSN